MALIIGDERHEGVLGTHCWEFSGGGFCADGPLPMPSSFVDLQKGTVLSVEGDFDSVEATLGTPRRSSVATKGEWDFVELRDPVRLDLSDRREALTADPARYVMEVFATWPEGDGVFSLGITITEPKG
ncbi:MAG TPA: hypothetical protein VHL78_12485 [Actinomycetota bacterium]|nr:hypothetical protein [Actinomycetota bacterium]